MNNKLVLVAFLSLAITTSSSLQSYKPHICNTDTNLFQLNYQLIEAAKSGDTQKVIKCLNNGDDVNIKDRYQVSALMWAAFKGHINCVQALLDHPEIDVNAKNDNGISALMCTALKGDINCAQLLISAGANIKLRDKHGKTALDLALFMGHQDIAVFLTDKRIKE